MSAGHWTIWRRRLAFPVVALGMASFVAALAVQTDPVARRAADLVIDSDRSVTAESAEALPHQHDAAAGEESGHVHDLSEMATTGDSAHVHSVATTDASTGSDGHDHTHPSPGDPGSVPTGPIVSIDDPRLTPTQQQAARTLLVSTRAAIASVPNAAALTAAGYVSAGDNSSGMSHWVKDELTHDGREVDAAHVETFMVERSTGRTVGAMYMLEPGKTMANVPNIAGELTTWHVHAPICFSTAQIWHFVSFASNGSCPPASSVRNVPPMMHVWLDDQACGPFTGTEGHGSATCSSHSH